MPPPSWSSAPSSSWRPPPRRRPQEEPGPNRCTHRACSGVSQRTDASARSHPAAPSSPAGATLRAGPVSPGAPSRGSAGTRRSSGKASRAQETLCSFSSGEMEQVLREAAIGGEACRQEVWRDRVQGESTGGTPHDGRERGRGAARACRRGLRRGRGARRRLPGAAAGTPRPRRGPPATPAGRASAGGPWRSRGRRGGWTRSSPGAARRGRGGAPAEARGRPRGCEGRGDQRGTRPGEARRPPGRGGGAASRPSRRGGLSLGGAPRRRRRGAAGRTRRAPPCGPPSPGPSPRLGASGGPRLSWARRASRRRLRPRRAHSPRSPPAPPCPPSRSLRAAAASPAPGTARRHRRPRSPPLPRPLPRRPGAPAGRRRPRAPPGREGAWSPRRTRGRRRRRRALEPAEPPPGPKIRFICDGSAWGGGGTGVRRRCRIRKQRSSQPGGRARLGDRPVDRDDAAGRADEVREGRGLSPRTGAHVEHGGPRPGPQRGGRGDAWEVLEKRLPRADAAQERGGDGPGSGGGAEAARDSDGDAGSAVKERRPG